MNEAKALIEAGKLALKHKTVLYNILCRKCKHNFVTVSQSENKREASIKTKHLVKDQLQNKTLSKKLCNICQRRLNKLVGDEKK